MNFVNQLEDYLRDLGAEARKKHPGVKEASERAILKLRTLQNQYVGAVRKASNSGEKHPDTRLFRSSDLLHPFLLAANYPNASPKLLDTSFKAMKTLMEADAICPGDGMNMVRVWMIQAQVVVSYSQTPTLATAASRSSTSKKETTNSASTTTTTTSRNRIPGTSSASPTQTPAKASETAETASSTGDSTSSSPPKDTNGNSSSSSSNNATKPAASSSSWFGGYFSSSPSGVQDNTAATSNATIEPQKSIMKSLVVSTKTAVSSSHGQAGSGHMNVKDLEKIALDILSCLLQLLELKDLPVSNEQWIQSVTLCCLLYLPLRQNNVRQAAHSSLPQVLTLLVKDHDASSLALKTWDDLLTCAMGFSSSAYSSSEDRHDSSDTTSTSRRRTMLHGAFCNCRLGEKDAAQPPSPALSLELMTTLLIESPTIFSGVGQKTFGIIVQILQNQSKVHSDASPLEYAKALQFALMILQTQSTDWPAECRELIARLIQPISLATEALRKQADFEDGYVYKVPIKQSVPANGSASTSNNTGIVINAGNVETLLGLPPTVLWKATLSMETLKSFIQDKTGKEVWLHEDVVGHLLEATSDFCTIGASCEDHMNLLVMACRGGISSHNEANSLAYSAETLDSIERWKKGKFNDDTYVLGDALWAGLNTLLKIIDLLDETVLEQSFAPALSVLQHYLKRFPASGTIVTRSLEGYFSLAKVSLNVPLLRRALLASLCKLSLPQWGSNDSGSQLKDHNVAALICLLNVVHRFYDQLGPEWSLVLQTFEELSIIAIASPHLSQNAYAGALSISAVYARLPSFSTCLSDESLSHFVAGLKEISLADRSQSNIQSTGLGHGMRKSDKANGSQEERESIGEKLMNIGARAIAWNSDGNTQLEDVPVAERTKNAYYDDYQVEFVNRLGSSRFPIRDRHVPFSVALLADVAMSNSFRDGRSSSHIFRQICAVSSEAPTFRFFFMDMLTTLILSHLSGDGDVPVSFVGPSKVLYSDPRQNQYLAVQRVVVGESEIPAVSQVDLIGPLCECTSSSKVANVVEVGFEALYSILEIAGHKLSKDSWLPVIQAISSGASPLRSSQDWSDSFQVSFRCLKLIIDDFLEDASSAARSSLLDCCSTFGSSHHDVNTSLTAIGLLWTIADKDAGTQAVETALAKLVLLSSDIRPEVRNCSVNTLFSCIVGRGPTFSETQWESCIRTTVFGVYDAVTSDNGESDNKVRTDETSKKKSRYRVSVHHSRDSADKQWLATQALVLRGLCRLLRNFFTALLNTTDASEPSAGNGEGDTPWFDEAWSKILGYAYDASIQVGGRDTLDLRIAGVELLVLCNQLSCEAGAQAAITPARVGTNMEVINGALRSVRSPEKSESDAMLGHSHSAVTEIWRENLFLDAFDVLDSYREHLDSDGASDNESGLAPHLEPTQVQVLSKMAMELSKLYDCCKEHEFAEDLSLSNFSSFQSLVTPVAIPPGDDDALVARFVRVVVSVATRSSSGEGSRFLSQAQRACVDLLKTMASNGSPEAFLNLTVLAGSAFFAEREPNGKSKEGVDILSHEISNVLCEEFRNQSLSDECKLVVLMRMLLLLQELKGETSKETKNATIQFVSYTALIPIVKCALESAKRIENGQKETSQPVCWLLDTVWKNLALLISELLSPVPDGSKLIYVSHAADIVELVNASTKNAPSRYSADLCGIFVSGASKSLDIARNCEVAGDSTVEGDALNVFAACFSGACKLQPDDKAIQQIAGKVLQAAAKSVEAKVGADCDTKAALKVCQVLQNHDSVDEIVIAVLSQLSQLVGVEELSLRRGAGGVLAKTNIARVVEDAMSRCKIAEERARMAEAKTSQLETEIEVLRKEKEALERQLAF